MNKKNTSGRSIDQLANDDTSSLNISEGKERPNGISGEKLNNFINKKRRKYSLDEYYDGIKSGNRVILGRALSLIESKIREDNNLSNKIVDRCLPYSGKSIRIGITGIPGVGKSTFIEAFGFYLLQYNKK